MFETLLPFGHLHLIALHLPIGLIIGIAFFEVAFARRMSAELRRATGALCALAAACAVLTAAFGLLLAETGGYEEGLVWKHRALGLSVAATSLLVAGLHRFVRAADSSRGLIAYRAALALCVTVLGAAGHYGASLTHGVNYLGRAFGTVFSEEYEAELVAAAHGFEGTSVFHRSIEPILEEHCSECHGESKQKSGLRLDSRAAALGGGESGKPAIVPGDAMASRLVWAITLPSEHEQAMPPIGKTRLEPIEVLRIIKWINRGAAWKDPLEIIAESVGPVPESVVESLQAQGVRTNLLASGLPLLRVDAPPPAPGLSLLDPIAAHIAWLDLGGAEISGEDWQRISQMKHLTRLDLHQSNTTDASLAHLEGLRHLAYLNIHSTNVSDSGLALLAKIDSLKKLYLWQTRVSDAGVLALHDALPELRINRGITPAVH